MFLLKKCLRFFFFLLIMFVPFYLTAQTNFFPLGIYNYDVGPGDSDHLITGANEIPLIDGLHTNYFSEMTADAQPGIINFCNNRGGTIRIAVGHDITAGWIYPVIDYNPWHENTLLWKYISDNRVNHIGMDSVEIFIEHVYNQYQFNHAGIGAIRVAHQGFMDQQDHFAFIRRACRRIQVLFGNDVQSVATHNIFHWDGGTSLTDFFSYMGDSLDVYQHEEYPFFRHHTAPFGNVPYIGEAFQDTIIDLRLLESYDLTRMALDSSTNNHTTLEVIIQTNRAWRTDSSGTYFRRPTEAEIWLQAFLALGRGFKGIHTYVYRSAQWTGTPAPFDSGIVTESATQRNAITPYYDQVAQLYNHLAELGDDILPLTVQEYFTWTGTSANYIQNITNDSLDGSHRTIEVSIFDEYDGNDYFMLINRRCSRDNSGTEAFPQQISLTLDTTLTGSYKIRDLYSDEIFVTNNKTFQNIELLAGRGRVFELTQAYPSDISGTVYYYSQVWTVSDALMLLVCGSGNQADTTDGTGNYEFADILPGNAHLTPTKEDDLRDGITGSDALLLLRYLAFLATLTEDQQFAADVTEDGSVSGSDAQALLRYLAFYADGIGSTGQWRFDPPDTSWLLLDDAEADFKAFLLGDVNGGWGPISRADSIGTLADVEIIIAAPEKNKDGLVEIPIKVSKVKDPLYTFLLSISYDPKYLAFQATGQTELTEKFMVVSNGTDPGIVHLAMAGISGIKDDGEIVRLLFKGAMADLSEKDLALKLTRAIINDYDMLKGNDGTISLPKRQVEQELTLIPDHYSLNQNYPNPFNPETEIRYQLPEAAYVSLAIYNLLGQKIRTLINQDMPAGFHSVKWDGKDDAGSGIASGMYIYALQAGSFQSIKKMVLMR